MGRLYLVTAHCACCDTEHVPLFLTEDRGEALNCAADINQLRAAGPPPGEDGTVSSTDFHSASVLEFIDGLPLNKLRALLRAKGGFLDDTPSLFVGSRLFSALAAAHSARDPN